MHFTGMFIYKYKIIQQKVERNFTGKGVTSEEVVDPRFPGGCHILAILDQAGISLSFES